MKKWRQKKRQYVNQLGNSRKDSGVKETNEDLKTHYFCTYLYSKLASWDQIVWNQVNHA